MPWNLGPSDTGTLVDIVKGIAGFGTPGDREALMRTALGISSAANRVMGSLDLDGAPDVVAARVINHLVTCGKLESGKESLELFLELVAARVDKDVGEEIGKIIVRWLTVPPVSPSQPSPDPFVPRTEDVKKAIRTNLNKIEVCKVLVENENEVGILDLLSSKLVCPALHPDKCLSEHITDFLTARRDRTDLGRLVSVFKQLYEGGKKQEAHRIGEIVDLMLPLCLPPDILSEAWRQLQDHGAVLIRNAVARKTGAEILVAGLYQKPTKFKKCSAEPTGEQLVPFERVTIGDPLRNVEPALREIYIATSHAEVKEEQGRSIEIKLTTRQIREDLRGHFEAVRLVKERPSYCAVELAANEEDRKNQLTLLSELGIPDLLFIGLAPDSKTRDFESFVITCLNIRFELEEKGKPV